jgi:hypothetical protein
VDLRRVVVDQELVEYQLVPVMERRSVCREESSTGLIETDREYYSETTC